MAQGEGSGGKVAIGCCSAIAVVVVAGIMVAVMFGGKMVGWFKGAMEEQADVAAAIQTWERGLKKAGGDPAALSPVTFDGFTLESQSDDVAPPGLDLGKNGHLAEYSNGTTTLSVWTAEVSELETEAMRERIKEQNSDRFSMNSNSSFSSGATSSMKYSGSPPREGGLLVTSSGWAILLQCNDPDLDLSDLLQKFAAEAAASGGAAAGETAAESETAVEAESGSDAAPAAGNDGSN